MSVKAVRALALLLTCFAANIQGQGAFRNLQFDDGPDAGSIPEGGLMSEYLPGWRLSFEGTEVFSIEQNSLGTVGNRGLAPFSRGVPLMPIHQQHLPMKVIMAYSFYEEGLSLMSSDPILFVETH